MQEHDIYNESNLDKVFQAADKDGNGTLCHKEVAALLGDDHEFSRAGLDLARLERMSAFDGKHPTLRQSPPMSPRSMRTVFAPN